MSAEKFFWFAAFKVAKNKSQAFQRWMEESHFHAIHGTSCFKIGWKKIIDTNTERQEGFDIILYRHCPISKGLWAIYNTREDLRPVLIKDFESQWKDELKNEEIVRLMNMAGVEIYEEEETTNDA